MVYLRIRSRAAGNDEKLLCLPNDRALTAIAEILNTVFQETNKQSSPLSAPSVPSCEGRGAALYSPPSVPSCEGRGAALYSPRILGLVREFFCSRLCALPFNPCARGGEGRNQISRESP